MLVYVLTFMAIVIVMAAVLRALWQLDADYNKNKEIVDKMLLDLDQGYNEVGALFEPAEQMNLQVEESPYSEDYSTLSQEVEEAVDTTEQQKEADWIKKKAAMTAYHESLHKFFANAKQPYEDALDAIIQAQSQAIKLSNQYSEGYSGYADLSSSQYEIPSSKFEIPSAQVEIPSDKAPPIKPVTQPSKPVDLKRKVELDVE